MCVKKILLKGEKAVEKRTLAQCAASFDFHKEYSIRFSQKRVSIFFKFVVLIGIQCESSLQLQIKIFGSLKLQSLCMLVRFFFVCYKEIFGFIQAIFTAGIVLRRAVYAWQKDYVIRFHVETANYINTLEKVSYITHMISIGFIIQNSLYLQFTTVNGWPQ